MGLRRIRIIRSASNTKAGKRYKLKSNNPDNPAQARDKTSKSLQTILA